MLSRRSLPLRSAPAQKFLPSEQSTTARHSGSSSRPNTESASSVMTSMSNQLCGGRCISTVATWWSRSTVTAESVLIARGRYRLGLVAGCLQPDKTLTFPRLCGRREPNPLGSIVRQDHEGTETMGIKKLVATVALAGAVTVGTAGAAFAADSSGTGSTDPSAQTGRGHPVLRREVRRGAVKVITDTLGVSRQDLRTALEGWADHQPVHVVVGQGPAVGEGRAGERGEHQDRPARDEREAASRTGRTPSRARSRPASTR